MFFFITAATITIDPRVVDLSILKCLESYPSIWRGYCFDPFSLSFFKTSNGVVSLDAILPSLCNCLKKNTVVRSLKIINFPVTQAQIIMIAEMLKYNTGIINLDISSSLSGDDVFSPFFSCVRHLHCLNLSGNKLSDVSIQNLSYVLQNSDLVELSLCKNNIDQKSIANLVLALKSNYRLKALRLGCNQLGDEGAASLSELLEINVHLIALSINDNNIGVEGAKSLTDALMKNTHLKTLNISNNPLGDAGCQYFIDFIRINASLQGLIIGNSESSKDSAQAVYDALLTNKTLTELEIFEEKYDDVFKIICMHNRARQTNNVREYLLINNPYFPNYRLPLACYIKNIGEFIKDELRYWVVTFDQEIITAEDIMQRINRYALRICIRSMMHPALGNSEIDLTNIHNEDSSLDKILRIVYSTQPDYIRTEFGFRRWLKICDKKKNVLDLGHYRSL